MSDIPEYFINHPLTKRDGYSPLFNFSWKYWAIQSISGMLAHPTFLVETGALSADNIKNFPSDLKKLLILTHHLKLFYLVNITLIAVTLQLLEAVRYPGNLNELKFGDFSYPYTPYLTALLLEIVCIVSIFIVGVMYKKSASLIIQTSNHHLSNCTAIITRQSMIHSAEFGRILFCVCVATLITHSTFFIKTGTLHAADVKSFPTSLKAKLIIGHYLLLASFAGLAFSIIALKLLD
ncbi:hypothetical protein [Pseudomonas aegrilactucae]|uniref:Uncharacterized protein n=1 Tax=Pseudomonas aegrilactucae TaxID=2854028 RepID=A0A9Q2XEB6_9PSED|nr:hypothetical protein [Pseudomonas aegrilactucae]MBV6285591.1 hypothetical protein [Pseudomonas aegrilactucae]